MGKIDFLALRSKDSLRKEILNIADSYNNPWDILCELTQNSYDSIKKFVKFNGETIKDHEINIEVDSRNRIIRVKDTGLGIDSEKIKTILSPNSTDKEGESDSIGEKGVGLTYTVFSCNLFEIKTKSLTSYLYGKVQFGSGWKNKATESIPTLEIIEEDIKDFAREETFTEIILSDVERLYTDKEDIFNQSTEVLEYILRTKTVIGYLKGIFKESAINLKVKLIHRNIDGKVNNIDVKPEYMLPTDFISPKKVIDLEDFKKTASTLDDRQKTKKLQGKVLVKIGAEQRSGRKINYYSALVPSRNTWKEISEKNKLLIKDDEGNDIYLYVGGIYTATKGMPTGITLESPVSGFSGYWPSFYIILEDDSIVFDLGRKTIPSRTKGLLKDIAKSLFNEFLPYIKYVTSDPEAGLGTSTTIQQYEKNKMFEEIYRLPDLPIDEIKYKKHPAGQEAAIVAIFHELIGADILKGYYTFMTGYKQTYDSWGIYKINKDIIGDKFKNLDSNNNTIELPCIIEFKFKAESILDDFEKNIKYFNDIDLIVCWDLDEIAFSKQQVTVEQIDKEDVLFYGSNYKLIWPGSYNLGAASEKNVLSLRKFLSDFKENM